MSGETKFVETGVAGRRYDGSVRLPPDRRPPFPYVFG